MTDTAMAEQPHMFSENIRNKVKTATEIAGILGDRPRAKKAIMCHGTFDMVHPGHVRHLSYAKSKADILVVSLTADVHVKKAQYRPFVPQDLRAINLAALEMVDFVVIDQDAKPLKNLAEIKPDYFAKGYEYVDGKVDPRTQEEIDVLNQFGGEFIFTPGDVVYSSSAIIEDEPPELSVEKLTMLLSAENVSFADLHNALDQSRGVKVHVIGDTIIDSYTQTTLIGGNTKTPTFSVRYEGRTDFLGGAGIVAKHLEAAGADVTFTTVLGDDEWRDFVTEDLAKTNVTLDAIIDPTRPTTQKNAIVAGGYRLLKIDTLDNRSISDGIRTQIEERIRSLGADVVAFSDFRHGIFNRATIPNLISAIPDGVFRVADSQVATRWGNILEFKGFDLITPNEREARFSLGDQDSVIRPLALKLFEQAECGTLMLKMGERGMITYRAIPEAYEDHRAFFVLDSFADHVLDAVGSGDALLAYGTLALKAAGNPLIASILGAIAAAVECEHDGNIPVTPDHVREKLQRLERRARFS